MSDEIVTPNVIAPIAEASAPAKVSFSPAEAKARAVALLKGSEAPVAPVAAEPKAVSVQADPKELDALAKMSKESRESKERYTALESETKTLREAAKLYKEGKKMEAIGLLSGQDSTVAMDELLDSYLQVEQKETAPVALSPEQKEIAELKKRLDDKEKAEASAAETARNENARQHTIKLIDPAKFPVSAKAQNQKEAAESAIKVALRMASEESLDVDAMTGEQADALLVRAMAEVESDFAALGERYSFKNSTVVNNNRQEEFIQTTPAPKPKETVAPTISDLPRPATVPESGPKNLTVEQAKERARRTIRAVGQN